MTEREAFEAQAELVGLETFLLGSTQTYAAPPTRVAWLLWQASRRQFAEEALRACSNQIPLGCSTSMVDVSRSQGVRACIDAIRYLRYLTITTGEAA